ISSHPGETIVVTVERDGQELQRPVTPAPKGDKNEGKIQVGPVYNHVPVGVGEAAKLSLIKPPLVVYETAQGIADWIRGKEKPDVTGPVGMVKQTADVVAKGPGPYLILLGALSAYLGAFNLLPIPALDGGRLLFLLVEAVSRRKPDAKSEAKVHAIGLLML